MDMPFPPLNAKATLIAMFKEFIKENHENKQVMHYNVLVNIGSEGYPSLNRPRYAD